MEYLIVALAIGAALSAYMAGRSAVEAKYRKPSPPSAATGLSCTCPPYGAQKPVFYPDRIEWGHLPMCPLSTQEPT